MNRVESSARRQVPAGVIEPLEFGIGVQPVACTPVAIAALGIATAVTAYYAVRDYKTSHGYVAPYGEMDALGTQLAQENGMSADELTGAVLELRAR